MYERVESGLKCGQSRTIARIPMDTNWKIAPRILSTAKNSDHAVNVLEYRSLAPDLAEHHSNSRTPR